MKLYFVAAAIVALMAGTGNASAQYATSNTSVRANSDIQSTTRHKRHHHRATVGGGITRDNNASASGSLLPGKDALTSKAFIQDH